MLPRVAASDMLNCRGAKFCAKEMIMVRHVEPLPQPYSIPLMHRAGLWIGLGLAAALAGCSNPPRPPATAATPVSAPRTPPAPTRADPTPLAPDGEGRSTGTTPIAQIAQPSRATLEPPKPVRSHDELRRQAALRLVAANPERTYMGQPPDILLAIPVLEVELNSDGSIKRMHVLRKPGQALDTVQLAMDAVKRAAPFGNVSRMPEPWKFTETFLFNNDRRFKPRTLD